MPERIRSAIHLVANPPLDFARALTPKKKNLASFETRFRKIPRLRV
jgi:hypothetical protein